MASGDGGGVGNERGSVHRRGVAVLLAARGLAGAPLTLPSGATFLPVRLDFETDQPTDDVKATADSGAQLFLSAKRTCGNDESSLGATVVQWVAQAPTLRPGDVLGLATAHLTGDMEHISNALKRHHASPGTTGPADETKALTALTNKIMDKTTDLAIRQQVLDAAYVLETTAVEAGDEGFDLAAALLNGTVVAAGDGPAAARALSEAFHTQASRASGSDLADWVRILRDDAKVRVFADGKGPAGAAEHARQRALEDHRTRLADQDGRLELSLLAEHLDPLTVPELADGLRVVVTGDRREHEPLLVIARRWPRLLLTGLPGMGKSTALRQLAARWALDPAAPLPILVPLPVVAGRCRQATDVTLSVLCEVAATAESAERRADLAVALEQACRQGHVVLLLDAFDECGDQRSVLATGLQMILTALPPQAGMVVTTRSSGLSAAQRLSLPAAELAGFTAGGAALSLSRLRCVPVAVSKTVVMPAMRLHHCGSS
ncbi:NACHT domain-containing protein [Paractinoplanes toevensis]|uniref:NACHT domain-containing protein n=1 Tax=Paractinoplanes toevensis TaxID=571911 RepID=UPI001BB3DFDC|nr:NACHT domain-containing protein [Actinoplanes toevensis]